MISPAEADALIAQHFTCLPIESLPLVQCAGAVLRENIYAERDQPPFDRVAMDGYAVATSALAKPREDRYSSAAEFSAAFAAGVIDSLALTGEDIGQSDLDAAAGSPPCNSSSVAVRN